MAIRIGPILAFVCLVGLSACGSPPAAAPVTTLAPTAAPQNSIVTPATLSASIPFKDSVLVAHLDSQANSMVLQPVDPATGLLLAGIAAVDLGANFDYGFTPDGRTLVFTKYVSSSPSRGELHFLDLATWQDDFAILLLSANWTTALAHSPDGTRLAVATAQADGSSLWLVDTERRVVLAHIQTRAVISDMKFTSDSQRLMDYERHEAANGGPNEGPPTVALRSTIDLAPEWSRTLTVVRDGFEPNSSFAGDPYEPGAGSIFQPAIVFSPDTDVLYVVHADVPKLTRVDFDRKSVLTLDIRPELSWFERLLMLSAAQAFAKEQNGVGLQARISPDGSVIYTDGVENTVTKQAPGNWLETQSPLKVQAIRTKDAAQIYQSAVTGANLDLSADGASLLVPQLDYATGAVTGTSALDASTGAATGQYQDVSLQFGSRMDDTPILLSSTPRLTDPQSTQMTAMTPGHRLLGSWTAPSYAQWLIKP
jgi:hypothetical protein